MVLNTIDATRKWAAEQSATAYVKTIENAVVKDLLNKVNHEEQEEVLEGTPILDKTKNLVYENGICKTDGTTFTSENEVTAKIGIISLDEYLLPNAFSSYLIRQYFWTMTPYSSYDAWLVN